MRFGWLLLGCASCLDLSEVSVSSTSTTSNTNATAPSGTSTSTSTVTDTGTTDTATDTGDSGTTSSSTPTSTSTLQAGDLVITEIMQRTSVPSVWGQWFEIHNSTTSAIDLAGLVVHDDNGFESFTVSGPLLVDAGGYVVFGINGDTKLNGGITLDYEWPLSSKKAFFIFSGPDQIVLSTGGPTPVEIDRVDLPDCVYSGTGSDTGKSVLKSDCFFALDEDAGEGVAHNLDSASLDATSNDDIDNWCSADTPIGSGTDLGTPGAANVACP